MPVIINGSTGLSGTDGSAATPAVQGTDTNTGMFFPAADQIAFAEGGVEAMRLDASGNVGIGTATPNVNTAGTVLHINNSTASRAAIIHMTNAETGSGAADGLIVGKWSDGTNYFFDYDNYPILFGTNNTVRAGITAAGDFQFNSGYGSSATAFGCRAWVNFNGTGTVAIRASGNVSSITDSGTGEYGVNFATPMVDANYSAVVAHAHWGGVTRLCDVNADGYFVNQFAMIIVGQQTTSWAQFDPSFVCVSIFR